ncbi:hypothetical protein HW555_013560 [Spodoptera exigua]|uniref:PiggyBac transposable element-derived protein domain-containing protein n=1 Tax=Spodoptera exigua TaxID=7107 RepID=A0A835G1F8_SPOEX|nr:hypothetical protein HW555_013560 [Spodoptera exigua]
MEKISPMTMTDTGCKPSASQKMHKQRVTTGIQAGAKTLYSRATNQEARAHILSPDTRAVAMKRVSTMPEPSDDMEKISPAKFSTGILPQTSLARANTIAIMNALMRILSCTEKITQVLKVKQGKIWQHHSCKMGRLRTNCWLEEDLVMKHWMRILRTPHATDTEQSSDETEADVSTLAPQQPRGRTPFYTGKDRSTKWLMHKPLRNVRTRSCNIVIHLPGVKDVAKNAKEPLQCFSLFMDDSMIDKIVLYTNIYITKLHEKFSRDRDCKLTDTIEIKALIGVLYMAGLKKISHLNVKEMWLDDVGIMTFLVTYKRRSRCEEQIMNKIKHSMTGFTTPYESIDMNFNIPIKKLSPGRFESAQKLAVILLGIASPAYIIEALKDEGWGGGGVILPAIVAWHDDFRMEALNDFSTKFKILVDELSMYMQPVGFPIELVARLVDQHQRRNRSIQII